MQEALKVMDRPFSRCDLMDQILGLDFFANPGPVW